MLFYHTENKKIPTELQKDALALQKSLAFDDEGGEGEWFNFCLQFL